jgi:hypothetical protein
MLIKRRCAGTKPDGQPCQMAPLHDRPFCFAHDPERAAEAAEARRMGGLRRRKEGTIADGSYALPLSVKGTVVITALPVAGLVGVPPPVSLTFADQDDVQQLNLAYDTGIR